MPHVGVFVAVRDSEDRMLCVKLNYGSGNWTLPGGHLEQFESPLDCVKREVLEETGFIVEPSKLISVYSAPEKDDLVLVFGADIIDSKGFTPNEEISEIGFFSLDELPEEIHPWNVQRIADVYEGKESAFRVFNGK